MKIAEIVSEKKLENMFLENESNNGELLVIDFFATWCGPCQMYIPIFDKVNSEKGSKNLKMVKIDIDTISEEMVNKYNVNSVPTTFFVKNGKIINRHSGFLSKDLLEKEIEKNNKL